MFTGIIEDQGIVKTFIKLKDYRLVVSSKNKFKGIKKGSSICCDGVCLTVHTIKRLNNKTELSFDVSQETVNCSNMGDLKTNYKINLERSLRLGDEISGHFVYGHVDNVTSLSKILKLQNSWEYHFKKDFLTNNKFIIEKASISINGISLTIANVLDDIFIISIIEHTYKNTNLQYLTENDEVNIEFDYLARFILKNE